jgi:hypothetical protein
MKIIIGIFCSLVLFCSCSKEGTGGDSVIQGKVKTKNNIITGAYIYLKFGAQKFPGEVLSDYDMQVISDSITADFKFSELKKGNYYLYSVAYDSTISKKVTGGVYVGVGKNRQTINTEIILEE